MSEQNTSGSNRRQFISGTTAAIAGATILGTSNFVHAGAHPFGDDEIKIGLIGCGGRGTGAADQALSTPGKTKLVAVGDAFRDRLDGCVGQIEKRHSDKMDLPEERKFVGFDAYKNVIASGCDLVILATPPGFRPIHFEAAVNMGKHVFMEKPVAVDAPGVRRVLAAGTIAREKGLGVGVGLQRRHAADYMETVKQIQDGALGDILLTRVYWNGGGVWVRPRTSDQSEMEYQMRNWYYFNWLCGDHIVEQHIHNLDVSNWLKGMVPISANGMGGREVRVGKQYGEIFDHFACEYTYPDGSTMLSQCRHVPGAWSQVAEYCSGSKGHSKLDSGRLLGHDGSEIFRFRGKGTNPYQQEHDDLQASIRAGSPINEAEYGATSTMTAILGRMVTYSGQVIKWDDAINSNISIAPEEYSFDAPPPVMPNADGAYPIPVPGKTQVV